jgi:hypothetical protein
VKSRQRGEDTAVKLMSCVKSRQHGEAEVVKPRQYGEDTTCDAEAAREMWRGDYEAVVTRHGDCEAAVMWHGESGEEDKGQ